MMVPRPGIEPGHSDYAKQNKVQREKASRYLHNLSLIARRISRISPRFSANRGAICPILAQVLVEVCGPLRLPLAGQRTVLETFENIVKYVC